MTKGVCASGDVMKIFMILLTLLVAGNAGAAEPIDADKLAQCFMTNSGGNETAAMKKFIVAGLNDDTTMLKSLITEFANILVNLALKKCGMSASQLADPNFQVASQKYGVLMGTKIMQDAFAKINN
ncbi:MAG: hypothetical protein J0H60_14290 [Rhizobiales bacterium]|nr:hypothetical protein [Hyphomicrobiales bacterium]